LHLLLFFVVLGEDTSELLAGLFTLTLASTVSKHALTLRLSAAVESGTTLSHWILSPVFFGSRTLVTHGVVTGLGPKEGIPRETTEVISRGA
jgi:hypothetical protein